MSQSEINNNVFSVLQEPGFVIFQVQGVKIKLPIEDTTVEGIHDKSQEFLTDLFNIKGVEEVFTKYGVVIEHAGKVLEPIGV